MVAILEKQKGKKTAKKGVWKSYIKLLFKAKIPWGWMILVTAVNLVITTLSLIFPTYAADVMTGKITKPVITGLIVVTLANVIISGVYSYLGKLLQYKIDISYRSLIWSRLLHSPMQMFDKIKPTSMVSRITTDAGTISQVLGGWVPGILSLIYGTVAILVIVSGYSWKLLACVLVYIPVYILINYFYGQWNYKTNKETYNRLSTLTQFLSELLMSVPLIKTFVKEKEEDTRGKENLQYYYKANMKKSIASWLDTPVNTFLELIQSIIVIGFGIYLVRDGSITINEWIQFTMFIGMLWGMLGTYVIFYVQLKQSQGATDRIAVLVESPLEEYKKRFSIDRLNDDIIFKNVSFSYGDKPVFTDMNFTIPRGKVTAIVGPSGGGKSTIFALLQQFYSVKSGDILLGSTSISEYNLKEWRDLFSAVDQDSPLISGTIRENIIYGVNREVSEREVVEAATKANALTFITTFVEGFNTQVGEAGSNLSGGQKQRIAIARAILRNTDILLLDEATASLDSQSEQSVQEAMHTLMKDRTTIIISHDLGNIQDADQIILVSSGAVDGMGTHDELMKSNELYRYFVQLHRD